MSRNAKLFRAIVVMGAAMTSSACESDTRCHHCSPPDSNTSVADAKPVDAGVVDAPKSPVDAPVDMVLIL